MKWILLQLRDFDHGKVDQHCDRQAYCGGLSPDGSNDTCPGVVDTQVQRQFPVSRFRTDVQGLVYRNCVLTGHEGRIPRIGDERVKASTNVTLVGPQIQVTPTCSCAGQPEDQPGRYRVQPRRRGRQCR